MIYIDITDSLIIAIIFCSVFYFDKLYYIFVIIEYLSILILRVPEGRINFKFHNFCPTKTLSAWPKWSKFDYLLYILKSFFSTFAPLKEKLKL